jgi:PAS domain S-box-containing protein
MKPTYSQLLEQIKELKSELKQYKLNRELEGINVLNENFHYLQKAFHAVMREYVKITDGLTKKSSLIKNDTVKSDSLPEKVKIANHKLNEDGIITDVNNQWLNLLEFERKEVIGKHFVDFIHSDYQTLFLEKFELQKSKVPVNEIYLRLTSKTKQNIYIVCNSQVYYSENNDFIQAHFTLKQISLESEIPNIISESERKLQILLSNLPGMAYRCLNKENWPMEYVSQGCYELTGYTKNELCVDGIIDYGELVHPEDRDFLWKQVKEASKNKSHFEFEYRIKTKEGIEKWVWERGIFVPLNNKNTVLEGFITDITQRKNAEHSLKESEGWYKSMFYDNKSIMLLINPLNGDIEDANDSALNYYGYTHNQITSKKISEINILSQSEIFEEMDKALIDKKNAFQFKHKLSNGEIRDVIVYSGKIVMCKKELLYSIIHDNTNELRAERILIEQNEKYLSINEKLKESLDRIQRINTELEEAKQKAEESDRLKSVFLANMSHEIRTPMNGIMGFANLLKSPELSGNKQKEYINIIENSGARMLNILSGLIDISKIEAGQVTMNREMVDIHEQLRYLFNFFYHEAKGKGINLSIQNISNTNDLIISTDKIKFYAILSNLVKNAIKYTLSGEIEIGYRIISDKIEFFVRDTGIGIEKQKQQSIFERFVQIENNNIFPIEGVGLGLAITKAYIKMLDGDIWLESEIDKGTTFYFNIPYNPIDSVSNEQATINNGILSSTNRSKIPKILIADDDEITDLYLSEVLKRRNFKLFHAKNGKEAIRVCSENPIDLVLMDIKMPEMDGFDATREIKSSFPKLPIIAQTAFAMADDRKKALSGGFDDFISKPIHEEKLLSIINLHLSRTSI